MTVNDGLRLISTNKWSQLLHTPKFKHLISITCLASTSATIFGWSIQHIAGVGIVFQYPSGSAQAPHLTDNDVLGGSPAAEPSRAEQ